MRLGAPLGRCWKSALNSIPRAGIESVGSKCPISCIDIDNSVVVVIQCILFVSKWRRSCGSCKDDDALEPEAR